MAEKTDVFRNLIPTGLTTAVGAFLAWLVLSPINNSQNMDARRDSAELRTREQLAELREEYRGEIGSLRADVETVKAGSKDRFTASDYAREDRRLEVELTQIKKEISRLEKRIDRLVRYVAAGKVK